MTTTIEYVAFLALDFPEDQVDQFGYARLREKARDQGLTLVGEVTRLQDEPASGVIAEHPDGHQSITYVSASSPAADGTKYVAAARLVRWEIQVEPIMAATAVKVEGEIHGDRELARVTLPESIAEDGGLVEFKHGLGGDCTVRAYGDDGEIGYSYSIALDDDRQEILLPVGAKRLEAVRDTGDEETAK